MGTWRKITEYKIICWLLITAVLLVTLLPAHYHLHHLIHSGSASHEHSTDLHFVMNKADQSHHEDNAHSYAAVPDGITKKAASAFIIFTFLIISLALISFLNFRINRRPNYGTPGLRKTCYYFYPPLRAPPLLTPTF